MSTLEATLRLIGSMVTIDLPSTRPTIQPAAWAELAANVDAINAPVRVSVFAVVLNIVVAPCFNGSSRWAARPGPSPMAAVTGSLGTGCTSGAKTLQEGFTAA